MELVTRGTNWFTRTFLLPSLHQAAQNGDLGSIQVHIRMGTDLNKEDKDDCTALVWATRKGHLRVVECLLNARADVNHKDKSNAAALTWAAINGDLPMVQCLIKFGADVDLIDKYGQTLLHFATRQNSSPCLFSCEELVGAKLRQMTAEQKKVVYTFLSWLKFGEHQHYYPLWRNIFKEPLRVMMREHRKPKILKEVNELSHKEIKAHLRAKYFPEIAEKLK